MSLSIFEIRNYRIQPGMRDHFIDYFEEHFIFSQQAEQMHILGQFRMLGVPDRFVWVRGYTTMQMRTAGLQRFYNGSFWLKHRARINAMILDSSDVHLLRSLSNTDDLTRGCTPDTIATELEAGIIDLATGVIAVDFYQADPTNMDTAAVALAQAYQNVGIHVRGVLTAELSKNGFLRHPALQNPGELVVISCYENEQQYQQHRKPSVDLTGATTTYQSLILAPTLRSPLRW
jgi:quinol monooxygenase YgiN